MQTNQGKTQRTNHRTNYRTIPCKNNSTELFSSNYVCIVVSVRYLMMKSTTSEVSRGNRDPHCRVYRNHPLWGRGCRHTGVRGMGYRHKGTDQMRWKSRHFNWEGRGVHTVLFYRILGIQLTRLYPLNIPVAEESANSRYKYYNYHN